MFKCLSMHLQVIIIKCLTLRTQQYNTVDTHNQIDTIYFIFRADSPPRRIPCEVFHFIAGTGEDFSDFKCNFAQIVSAVSVGDERAAVIGNERKVCAILRTCPQFWGYPLRRATKPATKPSRNFELWRCDAICLTSSRAPGRAEIPARDTYVVDGFLTGLNRT